MQVILQEFYKDLIDREACRLVEHVSGHLQNHFHGGLSRGKEMTEWMDITKAIYCFIILAYMILSG